MGVITLNLKEYIMRKRKALFLQMFFLPALLLICTAHSAYPTDISASKTSIENYLNEISETDKKISLKEEELAKLRSESEKTQQDSITRENTFKETVDSLNKESAHLESMVKKNEADQKKISGQRVKIMQDSSAVEKQYAKSLLKLARDRVYLDSLMDAMKKEKGQHLKEREKTNQDYSDAKEVFENTINQFQHELSAIDKKVATRAKKKDVLSLRHTKLNLDNLIDEKTKQLDSLMKMDRKIRLQEGGEFQNIQLERGKLIKRQKMLYKNADILHWEKSESHLSLLKRTALLDSIVEENNSSLVVLVRQRKKTAQDSLEVYNDFQKTFSEAPGKLKKLDRTITAIQKVEDSTKAEYNKLEPDSIAIVDKFLEGLEKVKKEAGQNDSLAQEKIRELAKLKEQREKMHQDILTAPKENSEAVEQGRQNVIKLEESIAAKENELVTLKETKINSDASLKDEITQLDNLIEKDERALISLLNNAGKAQLDKPEAGRDIKDSYVHKMEEELATQQKYLDSISLVTAYKRTEKRKTEIKTVLNAVETIYTLLVKDKAIKAEAEYTKEGDLLKKYMDDADYTGLKNSITRVLEKPKPVISKPKITPVITEPHDTIEQVETAPVEQEPQAPDVYKDETQVPPPITTEEIHALDNPDATVFINTIPPRAKIYMDGKLIGEANLGEMKIVSGTHEMKFVVNDKTCIRKITFEPGKNRSMLFRIPCGY